MIEWFDVFPFNLPPGMSFLGVYTLLAVATFVALRASRGWIARAFADKPAAPAEHGGALPLGQSYRSPDAPQRPPGLARGWLPAGSQVWSVAWLRGGTGAVEAALAAALFAEEWLTPNPNASAEFLVRGQGHPADPIMRDALAAIRGGTNNHTTNLAAIRSATSPASKTRRAPRACSPATRPSPPCASRRGSRGPPSSSCR
jgi:hypothetical protein